MEKNLIEILEPLTEDDVKVQYCDGTNCIMGQLSRQKK